MYIQNINSKKLFFSKLRISMTADNFSSTVWYLPGEGKKKIFKLSKYHFSHVWKLQNMNFLLPSLPLIFPPFTGTVKPSPRSAAIRSVIVQSDCDFFTMFLHAPLSQWTVTDPYQICRSARLLENSQAIKSCFTNLLDIYFSWFGAHGTGPDGGEWTGWCKKFIKGLLPPAYIGTVNIGMPHV